MNTTTYAHVKTDDETHLHQSEADSGSVAHILEVGDVVLFVPSIRRLLEVSSAIESYVHGLEEEDLAEHRRSLEHAPLQLVEVGGANGREGKRHETA